MRDEDLVSIGKIGGLRYLQLEGGAMTDAGVAHLAGLTSLIWLHVSGTDRLTDKALSYVADMNQLDNLSIRSGEFTDKGLEYLERLKSLEFLYLASEDAFSNAALNRLRMNLPNLQGWRIMP